MDVLTDIFEAGELREVTRLVHPDLPRRASAYRLRFALRTFVVSANPDDDTVIVVEGEPTDPDLIRDPAEPAWGPALGCHVAWAWFLTNQQGYTDALQLEFDHRRATLQLLAIGSCLDLYQLALVAPP